MSFIATTTFTSAMLGVAEISAVGAGAFSAYSAYQQGAASKAMANYQSQQEQVDAQQAYAVGQAQSEQVAQQGELNSQTLAFRQAQKVGAQRAAESANGLRQNSVTSENLAIGGFNASQRENSILNYDEQNKIWSIKTAAAEGAFTDTQQAALDTIQGENEMAAGEMNATGTLLSTAATVSGLAYKGSLTGQTLGSAPSTPDEMGTYLITGSK